jgi:hypothetical protein
VTLRGESLATIWPLVLCQNYSIPKGDSMAFRPNYGMQRADRNRAAQARREEKKRKREEKSAQRKAERILENNSSPDDAKTE